VSCTLPSYRDRLKSAQYERGESRPWHVEKPTATRQRLRQGS